MLEHDLYRYRAADLRREAAAARLARQARRAALRRDRAEKRSQGRNRQPDTGYDRAA